MLDEYKIIIFHFFALPVLGLRQVLELEYTRIA